jgi:hypothetical protein
VTGTADATTAWLRDIELLRRLPQRYARAIDARDIDAVAALFDPAGDVDGARGPATVPEWIDGLRNAPRVFEASMHVLGDPLIYLEPGSDEGRMDTYAIVYQLRAPEAPEGDMVLGIRYVDHVTRRDGDWVIRRRVARTLWTRRLTFSGT